MDGNKVVNSDVRYDDLNNSLELKIRDYCEREIKRQVDLIKNNLIGDLIKCMEEEHARLAESFNTEEK